MFNQNGVFYSEQHKISFGTVSGNSWSESHNTWSSWHLIPSSRPVIAQPEYKSKMAEIPGMDGMLDLTTYLTGQPHYGLRTGSLNFLMINHDGNSDLETVRTQIVNALHGKRLKMRLDDDPDWYYEGRFTVGNIESSATFPSISISYELDTYKRRINNSSTTSL